MKTNLQRRIDWEPAWDRRDPDPKKNYGVHGLTMRFLVSGKLGTVQFVLYTNWMLASIKAEYDQFERVPRFLSEPLPADIGYHSRTPRYEGQNPMFNIKIRPLKNKKVMMGEEEVSLPDFKIDREFLPTPCQYLNGDPCFYDGSSLNAIGYFNILLEKGIDALWIAMEDYYIDHLGGEFGWPRHFYIFQDIIVGEKDKHVIKWFYIYRHQNGGWERSPSFDNYYQAIWSKIKTHCKVYYRKSDKFISTKLYNAYAMLATQARSFLSRYLPK